MSWSLSVKTVGSSIASPNRDTDSGTDSASSTEKPQPTNFVVNVEPEDLMSSLHEKIEDVTGLKTSQQRLIYRGRIISGGSAKKADGDTRNVASTNDKDSRLCDVAGLGNGQTIHLVPRPPEATATATATVTSESTQSSTTASNSDGGSASVELLAALLGIGSGGVPGGDNDGNDENNGSETDLGSLFSLPRTRVARSTARRRRANSHRRTANDPRHPEPGSLEPVRQGLMTLHTMINSHSKTTETTSATFCSDQVKETNRSYRPLDANRPWYRGQWIDCRDTVNQWLEATVVDIVSPKDILNSLSNGNTHSARHKTPTPDPAVGANDLEGRRRLLLETTENELDDELSEANGGDEELIGYRERPNNYGVQLLLIHYNGWPHRWDEWIRSDSERIRPFRTRSKHTPNRSNYASPTPQSVFHASPATYFKEESETCERVALLPELHRSILSINNLVSQSIPPEIHERINRQSETDYKYRDQPWMSYHQNEDGRDEYMNIDGFAEKVDDVKCDDKEPTKEPKFDKRKLEAIAPLLDRLGRILTDAAPHIASYAESLPEVPTTTSNIEGTGSPSDGTQQTTLNLPNESATTPLLASFSADGTVSEENADAGSNESNERNDNDPDYVDFVNGFVNVVSNERTAISGRSNARRLDRDDDGPSSIGSSLLSAYLASSGSSNTSNDNNAEEGNTNEENGNGSNRGPRVVRLGGGNSEGNGLGPGIDIHIHAIVTGPGGGVTGATGGLGGLAGLAAMGMPLALNATAPPSRAANSDPRPSTTTVTPVEQNDDDDGLFSDLYSESPEPIDLSHHHNDSRNSTETQTVQNSSNEPMEVEESNVVDSDNELDDLPPLESNNDTSPRDESTPIATSDSMPPLIDDRVRNRTTSSSTLSSGRNESSYENSSGRATGEPRTAFGRFFRRTIGRRHHNGT